MQFIMFTKHLEGKDIGGIIEALKSVGVEGADLCVRPNYPVTPENAPTELPKAAKAFADARLSIPLITTPGRYTDPNDPTVEPLFAACAEAGVKFIKLGYWLLGDEDYWTAVDKVRKDLEGFAQHARKSGVTAVFHTHSGPYMGLNASAVMHLVKGFDPDEVGVFLDAGHLALMGEPAKMALSIVKDHLQVMAFKDLSWQRVIRDGKPSLTSRTMRLGEGLVDWEAWVTGLQAMKFDGPISFHSEYTGVPVETVIDLARTDVRYLRALLAS